MEQKPLILISLVFWLLVLNSPLVLAWDGTKFKKPSPAELKAKLTSMQYEVTQNQGTEPPFHNDYWNNHRPGIYVDIVSGEPLFSSLDKFDSGTGWPSFTRPIKEESIVKHSDHELFQTRTELQSKSAGSHLGHVFDDGPKPTGLRYCIDSASLRFVAADDLEKEGYSEFRPLFPNTTPAKTPSAKPSSVPSSVH